MQVWIQAAASPRGLARQAADAEAAGWDGIACVDSQNLSGDPFVALAMAAAATSRIGLATATSNPVTRLPAAAATAIASVDAVAKGRAWFGIGRGDSALAHLGRSPARLKHFERYLKQLQVYLAGQAVPFGELGIADDVAPPLEDLGLAGVPADSRIAWLEGRRKVPVEVAASGPKVIALAALNAERVMFALGADPVRVAWGIETAKAARRAAGLDPEGIAFGAYVNCVCHRDIATARELAKGGLTTYLRFSVMHGKTVGPTSPELAAAMQKLRAAYDMNRHTRGDSAQAATLTADVIDSYAIVGPPEACLPRLEALARLGLEKISVAGSLRILDSDAGREAFALFSKELLPAVQAF
jgi:5,10-methylenetetrahydromethanopterin reductase